MRVRRTVGVVLLLVSLVSAGCTKGGATPQPTSAPTTVPTTAPPRGFTFGDVYVSVVADKLVVESGTHSNIVLLALDDPPYPCRVNDKVTNNTGGSDRGGFIPCFDPDGTVTVLITEGFAPAAAGLSDAEVWYVIGDRLGDAHAIPQIDTPQKSVCVGGYMAAQSPAFDTTAEQVVVNLVVGEQGGSSQAIGVAVAQINKGVTGYNSGKTLLETCA